MNAQEAERLAEKSAQEIKRRVLTTKAEELSAGVDRKIISIILRETNLASHLARIEELEAMLIPCPHCDGKGKKPCGNPDHNFIMAIAGVGGRSPSESQCPECGYSGVSKCDDCNGTGKVPAAQLAALNAVAKAAVKVNEESECTCGDDPEGVCVYCSRYMKLEKSLSALRDTGWRAEG